MNIYVATSNPGKLAEMQAIFAGSPLELITYPEYVAAAEGESSYTENALRKARSLQEQLRAIGIVACVLADDSGLEVEALENRPGVLSARYGGENATWDERRAHLLHELEQRPDASRDARFISHIALILDDGLEIVAAGAVGGLIAEEERGEGGFGYDSIFFYQPANMTFGQMSEAAKNRCSHRRRAADNLLKVLALHGR
ncbi:MAG: RdgB/HAM1 family non-canonical purine NTP pyrophosphatase [Vulcanimicrobiaceae bacterium]